MLARVVNNIHQGGILSKLCFNNVAYELQRSTTNKKLHPWSNSYTHFCQYRNMSKDGTKSDVLVKVLADKQFQKNVNIQKNPKLFHGSSSNLENIKKVNLKPQELKRAIFQESGDKILQQAKRCLQSCKALKKSGSGPKCLVENKEYHKPFKKTVAFDLTPRVLHQCENPFQCTNIHCIKPYGTLVGILKKSKENMSRNVFPKPYFLKKSIYCAIQSQARNFCQSRPPSKINTENEETNLNRQDATRKQITSQIPEKNAPSNEQQLEPPPPPRPMEMKSIHPSFTQETDDHAHTLKEENKNILLKKISKSMNNLNTFDKSLVKFPGPIQTKEVYNLRKHRRELYRLPSVARSDNRLAFSTSSGDYKDKNRCKSSRKRKRKSRPQRAKKCKSKASSSENKCNPRNAEQRTKVLKSICAKEDTRDPEEFAKLLESCFPKSEMSSECDSTPTQTTCEETTKNKQSKLSNKTRGICEKSPQSKKPKCEKEEKKGVIDVGCKSSLQKMCQKVTNQITVYSEKKKKMKKKKKIEPCELTCLDVCADDGIMKDGEVPPGSKRNCRFVCENGQNPCDPPKRKKGSKTNVCKEMFRKKMQTKKKKCSKKPKKKEIKCSETEKKKKIQKRTSCADVCLGFQKAFRKKPQLYSGECEKTKKKSQRIKVCENSFKKMLRKIQKRKTH